MKCPRCVQPIYRAALRCPHCGFSREDADAIFGLGEIRVRCLTDRAGLLTCVERVRVQEAMERIGRIFPQLFVGVYTVSLGGVSRMRQFGFWFLNRAVFEDLPDGKLNEAGVILTMDPETKVAGMVFGYLLDPYLTEEDTFECLAKAYSSWADGHYADGIVAALKALERVLWRRCHQARRDPDGFLRKIQPQGLREEGIRLIRMDHQTMPLDAQSASGSSKEQGVRS